MKIKKNVVLQKMGDTFVAYDNDTSTLHELNEVAYIIVSEIEKGKSKEAIVAKLLKTYTVERKKAQEDLNSFLKELRAKDLIVGKK